MEIQSFGRVSSDLSENRRKLRVLAKFQHQEIK